MDILDEDERNRERTLILLSAILFNLSGDVHTKSRNPNALLSNNG